MARRAGKRPGPIRRMGSGIASWGRAHPPSKAVKGTALGAAGGFALSGGSLTGTAVGATIGLTVAAKKGWAATKAATTQAIRRYRERRARRG